MSEHTPGGGRYPHVMRAVTETPWAVDETTLHAIRDLVALRSGGQRFTAAELEARIGDGPSHRSDVQMVGSVAVLPLYGVIMPRADLFNEMSGGTSVDRFRSAFLDAVEDDTVSAVVLDVASPGGMTDLIPELAADMRAARGAKPIVAVANTKALSAAYWLAAQADEIVVTPSGIVGSIGVYSMHEDISGQLEQDGVTVTLISAGENKTECNPYEPLSDEAREAMQARVDEMAGMFVSDVAAGRRVGEQKVRESFGRGRVMTASQAAAVGGMVDGVGTLRATVARLQSDARKPRRRGSAGAFAEGESLTFAEEAAALHGSATDLVVRMASLAEVDRGVLTAAKREALAACPAGLRESADAIDRVLTATDPNKNRDVIAGEYARFVATTSRSTQ